MDLLITAPSKQRAWELWKQTSMARHPARMAIHVASARARRAAAPGWRHGRGTRVGGRKRRTDMSKFKLLFTVTGAGQLRLTRIALRLRTLIEEGAGTLKRCPLGADRRARIATILERRGRRWSDTTSADAWSGARQADGFVPARRVQGQGTLVWGFEQTIDRLVSTTTAVWDGPRDERRRLSRQYTARRSWLNPGADDAIPLVRRRRAGARTVRHWSRHDGSRWTNGARRMRHKAPPGK